MSFSGEMTFYNSLKIIPLTGRFSEKNDYLPEKKKVGHVNIFVN